MRILVCGGRSFDDYPLVRRTLDQLCGMLAPPDEGDWLPPADTVIIHGSAPGADMLADRWASLNFVRREVYRANWKRFGPAAGPLRNQMMVSQGRPNIVVAFPGGAGTADMVHRARVAGVDVLEVRPATVEVEAVRRRLVRS